MKIYNSIILVLTILLFISCEKEIDFDKTQITPKLVLNGFITPDSLIEVSLGSSKSIPGFESNFTWIDDAQIELYVDGEKTEDLNNYPIEYTENDYYNFNTSDLPQSVYRSQKTYAEVGKTYKLVVTHPDYETINCETTIPTPPVILSIDTIKETSDEYYQPRLKVKIKFNDTPKELNYYRLVYTKLEGRSRYGYNGSENDSLVIVYEYIRGTYIDSDDPIINPEEEDANDFLYSSSENQYNLFNDELIEGKEYELSFNVDYPYLTKEFGEFYHYYIELQALSYDEYFYLKSVEAYNWYEGDFFSEPVQVYTNIENGVGIFAGASSTHTILEYGEYPKDGFKYEFHDSYY